MLVWPTYYMYPKDTRKEYANDCLEIKNVVWSEAIAYMTKHEGTDSSMGLYSSVLQWRITCVFFILGSIPCCLYFCCNYCDTAEEYTESSLNKHHVLPCLLWSNQYTSRRIINNNAWIFLNRWMVNWMMKCTMHWWAFLKASRFSKMTAYGILW